MSHKLVSLFIGEGEYYTRTDADNVIAELKDKLRHYPMIVALLESDKKEIAELKERLIECQKMHKRCSDNAIKELHYQKYKRCLAMAKKCHAIYEKYSMLASDDRNWEEEDYYFARWRFFEKWKYKWLELAEKFKEAK